MRLSVLASLLVIVGIGLISCDGSGIAGSGTIDNPGKVVTDTFLVDQAFLQDIQSFSGGRTYISAGAYNDELFGDFTFTAIMKPSINRSNIEEIESSATASIRLAIDNRYGNTTGAQQFDIVEVDRLWRSRSWRQDSIPSLSNRVLGSFTLTDEEEITVPITDNEWIQEYREIFILEGPRRDSLYANTFHGFAIVPTNAEQVVSFPFNQIQLKVDNNISGVDTVYTQPMARWAYSIDHQPKTIEEDQKSFPVFNNFKNNFVMEIRLEDWLEGTGNISRAELVVFEDTLSSQTTLPDNHVRPRTPGMFIYLLTEAQTEISVTGQETFAAVRRNSDASWRFNITNYARSQLGSFSDQRNFFMKIGRDDGRFFPYYIHNHLSEDRAPKVIITRIIAED